MISANDVENYKQIKADLDDLRNIVEKSELWVYKDKSDDDSGERDKKVVIFYNLVPLIVHINPAGLIVSAAPRG